MYQKNDNSKAESLKCPQARNNSFTLLKKKNISNLDFYTTHQLNLKYI